MRLLLLDESPEVIGGVDTYRRAFAPEAAKLAETVVWACSAERRRREPHLFAAPGVTMVDLHPDRRSWQGLVWAALRRIPPKMAPWRANAQQWLSHSHLRKVCRRHRLTHVLELCVNHQPFPQLHRPTAGVVHDLSFFTREDPKVEAALRSWTKDAVKMFCDSAQTRADLLGLDASVAPRAEVVLLASPPVQNPPAGPNPFARKEPVFYYPARTTWHKGHDVILGALAKLAAENQSFHCYFSGHGTDRMFNDNPSPERDTDDVRLACRKYREPLSGRVTLLGPQPWATVEQLFQAANLVVLPTRFEGFGLPLSEALRRNKPVIASRVPSLEEQVAFFGAEEQARWVPLGDEAALATALGDFLAGRLRFPEFSPALRERVAAWTWAAVARKVLTELKAAASA